MVSRLTYNYGQDPKSVLHNPSIMADAIAVDMLIQVHRYLGEGCYPSKAEGVITRDEDINLVAFICDVLHRGEANGPNEFWPEVYSPIISDHQNWTQFCSQYLPGLVGL